MPSPAWRTPYPRPTPASARVQRGLLVLLLTAALFANACGSATPSPVVSSAPSADVPAGATAAHAVPNGATAPVDDATWALVDRLTAPTYTTDTTAAMVAALGRAGIATYTDTTTTSPDAPVAGVASPFELLDFQAHALAVGVWAGATWSGAELDGVIPLPDGSKGLAPTSAVLAGYVAAVDSPGAALARALMAGQDLLSPSTLRFPGVVLVLFASDLATDGGRVAVPSTDPATGALGSVNLVALAESNPGSPPMAREAIAVNSICSDTASWTQNMLTRLFGALKVAVPDNVPGAIVASIWNWLVDVAHTLVNDLITSVTDLVLGTIRNIAATIAAVAEQVASLLPYAVKVRVTGGSGKGTFDLGPAPMPGTLVAVVTAGDLPSMPAVLVDCAKTTDIALPDFHAKQVPVTWGPIEPAVDPLLAPTDSTTFNGRTDDAGTATWGFLTSRDPGDPGGEPLSKFDHVPVAVHRPEIEQARAKLTAALLGYIPALVRPFVTSLFAPYLDGLQGRLNTLLDARGWDSIALRYHAKVPPTPVPSTTLAPSSACSVTLPAGSYNGTLKADTTTIVPPGQIDLGESGGDNSHGSGPVTVTVAADGTLGGNFQQTLQQHQVFTGLAEGTTDTTIQEEGAGVSGTLCSLTLTFASETITDCHATGYGTCGQVGATYSLAGLVPALPLGVPTSVAGGAITWSISSESSFDAGFGGLSAEVQSTITLVLQTP